MSSFVIDGLELPVSIGGHPALDFCNTRAGWGSSTPKEYLRSYDHLAVWTREVGLLDPATVARLLATAAADGSAANAVLSDALTLREATYAVALGSPAPRSFGLVARQASAARCAAMLALQPPGSPSIARWVLLEQGVNAPLLAVAAQVDDLLNSPLSTAIGACPGRGCGWLFADPRRRRRWCDMAVCGNRAKARRHAQRVARAD